MSEIKKELIKNNTVLLLLAVSVFILVLSALNYNLKLLCNK